MSGGDSFRIDITSDSDLDKILSIVCDKYTKGVAYKISPEKGMIFYQYKIENKVNNEIFTLPFGFGPSSMAEFANGWIKEMDFNTFKTYAGEEPDHDGDNSRGFRVFNEDWGHISGEDFSAFIAIKPVWIMYAK